LKKIIQNPLNIVIGWWSFWGIISLFSFTGLYIPSIQTYLILSLFVISMFAGGKLVDILKNRISFINHCPDQIVERKLNNIFKFNSIVLFLVLLVLVFRSSYLVFHSFTPTVYRATAFSTITKVGRLFNNKLAENLYFFISSPVLFFLALYGLVEFWKKGKFQKLIIAFILNSMDAVIRLGRVNLYLMIVLFGIVFIVSDYKVMAFLKHKKKQISLVLAAFVCILYIGVQRGYSPSQQFKMFVIDYHTVGFDLFDHELVNKMSPLNIEKTYGRLTFGGLETIGTIIIRQFHSKNYYSPALSNSIRMAEQSIVVGVEDPPTIIFNGVKVYNSFYTLLYTFYSDAGYVGIILGGVVLGFFLQYFYKRWKQNEDVLDAFFLVLTLSIGILSIFMSQLEIMRTWMIIIFLIFLSFTSRVNHKNEAR
jgi:oligosaccharide repeat unit polymerase